MDISRGIFAPLRGLAANPSLHNIRELDQFISDSALIGNVSKSVSGQHFLLNCSFQEVSAVAPQFSLAPFLIRNYSCLHEAMLEYLPVRGTFLEGLTQV